MKRLTAAALAATFMTFAPWSTGLVTDSALAAEIAYVVNKNAVTTHDINRRVAFLRLQGQRGNLREMAADQMIDQVLRLHESKRVGINISKQEVDAAFARFGKTNNLGTKQLSQILRQAGVGTEHFKDFIRSQIAWGQAVQRRAGASNSMTRQEVTRRLLERKDNKPTATEYLLQQVIFVVPSAERKSLLARRKNEADSMRSRVSGCNSTRAIAKEIIDVTVRDLGRKLEPELPQEWKDTLAATAPGQATATRETERGVEFLVVCDARTVSDDRVAELTFRAEDVGGTDSSEVAETYMAEVRKRAEISKR